MNKKKATWRLARRRATKCEGCSPLDGKGLPPRINRYMRHALLTRPWLVVVVVVVVSLLASEVYKSHTHTHTHVWFLDSSRQPRHRHSHAGVGFVDWVAWMLTHMRVLAVCVCMYVCGCGCCAKAVNDWLEDRWPDSSPSGMRAC